MAFPSPVSPLNSKCYRAQPWGGITFPITLSSWGSSWFPFPNTQTVECMDESAPLSASWQQASISWPWGIGIFSRKYLRFFQEYLALTCKGIWSKSLYLSLSTCSPQDSSHLPILRWTDHVPVKQGSQWKEPQPHRYKTSVSRHFLRNDCIYSRT